MEKKSNASSDNEEEEFKDCLADNNDALEEEKGEEAPLPDIEVHPKDLNEALKIKMEGTELFKQGDIQGAINKYSLALAYCPNDEENERKQLAILHNNIGICLMKLVEHEPIPEPQKLFPDPSQASQDDDHPLVKKAKAQSARQKAQKEAKDHFT